MSPAEDHLCDILSHHCCHHGFSEVKSAISRFLTQIESQEVKKFAAQLDWGFSHTGDRPLNPLLAEFASYKEVVDALVSSYKEGVDSGDWGFWEFEDQKEVVAFRKAESSLEQALSPLSKD